MPNIFFRNHATEQMFEREISREAVLQVINEGKVITEYPEDRPYPSCLMLGWIDEKPLHVVAAFDEEHDTTYVITAYWPDPSKWSDDFETRMRDEL